MSLVCQFTPSYLFLFAHTSLLMNGKPLRDSTSTPILLNETLSPTTSTNNTSTTLSTNRGATVGNSNSGSSSNSVGKAVVERVGSVGRSLKTLGQQMGFRAQVVSGGATSDEELVAPPTPPSPTSGMGASCSSVFWSMDDNAEETVALLPQQQVRVVRCAKNIATY